MAEGTRRVTLLEPGPLAGISSYGEQIPGEPVEHKAWATRLDRGGSEGIQAETQVGEWKTRFEVRMVGLEDVSHTWALEDERGRSFDVEAVAESPTRRWWLYCVNRD